MKFNINKKSIGIDIDGTAFDTDGEILNYIGLYYNEIFPKKDIKIDLEASLPGVEKHIIFDAIDIAVADINLPFNKGAKNVIQWLSEYYNIYFVTYRPPDTVKVTTKLLNRLDIDYELIMVDRKMGKYGMINYKNIKVFIEDDTPTILDIEENTETTCLIYNQPWNVNILQNEQTLRMYGWKEIKDYFIIRGVGE